MTEQDNWESHDWSPDDHKCRKCGAPISDKEPCPKTGIGAGKDDTCPYDGRSCYVPGEGAEVHFRCGTSSCSMVQTKAEATSDTSFMRSLSRDTLEALCGRLQGDLLKCEKRLRDEIPSLHECQPQKDFTLAGYTEGGIIARTLFTARAAAFSPAPHWDQETNPLRAECLDDARDVVKALAQGARQHAPGLMEEACEWMIARGYATGSGDTMSDLMTDLCHQVRERALKECAIVADGVRVNPKRTIDDSWREASGKIVGRIRALIASVPER